MKIGILGSGNMGRALGMRWAINGHQVFFGGRDLEKTKRVAAFVGNDSQYGSLEDAVAFGDILLHTMRDVLPSSISHVDAFTNKVIIDLNNHAIPEGFAYQPITESFTELFQTNVPTAYVVKAFNMFAMEMFEHSPETIASHDVSAFIAGNSQQAKDTVSLLASELGFTPVDAGNVQHARLLEGSADLIRLLMIDKGMGAFTAISAHTLPKSTSSQLGGRQHSNFN